MKIVTISDTHTYKPEIPDGDILLHAGDATYRGLEGEVREFGEWFQSLPHKYKIFVPGNHDLSFESNPLKASEWFYERRNDLNTHILIDQFIEIEGLKIWGTPWQPWFGSWAFNIKKESDMKEKWDMMPNNTDIMIVHGPPYGVLDQCQDGSRVGSKTLKDKIRNSNLKLVVCGHIHENYGVKYLKKNTIIANSSICTLSYRPVNKPHIFDYDGNKITYIKTSQG